MEREAWDRIKEIFESALERPDAQREAYLDEACAGADDIRSEIDQMLRAHREARLEVEYALPPERSDAQEADPALATALAGRFEIAGLVGVGGMATVYRARDLRHSRTVAIKVLKPELAALLGPARFKREIETAARLQHPHIVPLFDSGEAGGRLYYVMPFVEGESLRERVAREGALPVQDVMRIFRDIVDALREAHAQDVIHRDIKPDNVLVRGDHAVVTDFGIAKAISESVDRPDLTRTGVSMGTPRYMAPEQAAAEPSTDHRADLFAAGAVAYEMLCGTPPFDGASMRAVLQAVMVDTPTSPSDLRPDVPAALGDLVMECLAKQPEDRPQTAEDVLRRLDDIGTATGSPRESPAFRVWLPSVLYAAFSWIVFEGTRRVTEQLVLPDWVPPLALLLLAAGFVVPLAIGHARRGRTRRTGLLGRPLKRATAGGLGSLGVLALVGIAWALGRAWGLGSFGTLVSTGVLDERDVLILADFEGPPEDPVLAAAVTEALRVDLSQSRAVRIAEASLLGSALARMQRAPDSRVTRALAAELGEREGLKAVISGEVAPVGAGFLLTARLEEPAEGTILLAHRESARDSTELIQAIDALSARLRERIGEPLRSLASSAPLERVTTADLEALRLFSEATQLPQAEYPRRIRLLEEAIARDSTFAFAWRGLSISYNNHDYAPSRALAASTRAFELRERLTETERAEVEATYYTQVLREPAQALTVLEAAVARDPTAFRATANLARTYIDAGQPATAVLWLERALQMDSTHAIPLMNLPQAYFELGEFEQARGAVDRLYRQGHFPYGELLDAFSHLVRRRYVEAERVLAPVPAQLGANPYMLGLVTRELARTTAPLGQVSLYRARMNRAIQIQADAGVRPEALRLSAAAALTAAAWGGSDRSSLDRALERFPLSEMDPIERPYLYLADVYAQLGYPGAAAALLEEFDAVTPEAFAHGYRFRRSRALGQIALAEGRHADAIAAFRASAAPVQAPWDLAGLARAFDAAEQPDSARSYYVAYLEERQFLRMESDPFYLAPFLLRLTELEQEAGNLRDAARWLGEFIELWDDADPELQPRVVRARGVLQSLEASVGS